MAFNLLSLLQAAAGQDAQQPPFEDEEIVVQAPRREPAASRPVNFPSAPNAPVLSNGPDAPDFGNRSYVEAARAAMKNLPERSGMFGTRGTLRDILGTVGDAFLLQSGNKPMYAPQRELERTQDAMSGMTANPMAAVERLAQAGDPILAQKLMEESLQSQQRGRQLDLQQTGLSRQAVNDKDERYQQYSRLFSQYAGAATPETWARIAPILKTLKERGALGEEFQVPDTYDKNLLTSYQFGGMPAQQQVSSDIRKEGNELRKEGLKIQQQNADSSRIRANRPPAGRAAPQPTNAAMAAPLIAKVKAGKPLTAGEAETLNRLGYSPDRGRGRTRTPPPLPPGFRLK